MVGPLLIGWSRIGVAASLTVSVQTTNGDAVPHAEVLAINPELEATSAFTNSRGDAQFEYLPPARYRLRAIPPTGDVHVARYHPNEVEYCDAELVALESTTTVTIQLPEGESVSGRITDAEGTPINGVRVRASAAASSAMREGWSDADGAFTIRGLEPHQEWRLQAAKTGFPVQWWGGSLRQSDAPLIAVTEPALSEPWSLLSGVTVSGSVTGPSGAVQNATVRVYSNSQVTITNTDDAGRYAAKGVPVGSMTAWATADGFAVTYLGDSDRPDRFVDLTVDGESETGVDITMPSESTLRVQLTGSAPLTDGSLENISVVLYNDERTVGRGEQTDSNGVAHFSGLHGGDYEVYVYGSRAGHADDWARDQSGQLATVRVAPESVDNDFDVPLGIAHSIHGRVVDEWGQSIQGVDVVISEHRVAGIDDAQPGGLFVESTDADGEFIASGIPDGTWNIRVQADPVCPADPGHVAVYLPNTVDPLMADRLFIESADAAITEVLFTMPDDRDHDGMGDRWERKYGLDLQRNDALEDPDGDGLNNLTEYRMKSDPLRQEGYWVIVRRFGCATATTALTGWALLVPMIVAFSRRRGSTWPQKLVRREQ